MKLAWPAKSTLSIPTLLTVALRVTPPFILKAKIFSYADMLPVMVFMSMSIIAAAQAIWFGIGKFTTNSRKLSR